MKKLLVGSIFSDDKPLQKQWLDIQLKYLSVTTDSYDHVAVVSKIATDDYFGSKTKVIYPQDMNLTGSDAHTQGLNLLLEYFRSNQSNYENFLFIDGDAFPIKKQWMLSLLNKMDSKDIAIAIRSENLETRWHASILFAKRNALDHLSFEMKLVGNDLAGNKEEDVSVPVYQFERRNFVFPLIRTNQFNLHPVACGIYYDMFYHHCCGSGRWLSLRSNDYYNRIVTPIDDLTPITNRLFQNPNEFIKKIAGWSVTRYGIT